MKKHYIYVSCNGDKYYYRDKEMVVLHRKDGPAVEYANGSTLWYIENQLHREDGPAITGIDLYKSWYINGKKLSEEEFNARKNSCNGKVIEVDGKKYRLTRV